MKRLTIPLLSLALSSSFLPVFGCSSTEDSSDPPINRSGTSMHGYNYELVVDEDLTQEQVREVAQFIEASGGDVHQAKVKVGKQDTGPMVVSIELWGAGLADADLEAELKQRFPYLAHATMTTADLGNEPGELESEHRVEVDEGEDPEIVKQQIIEQLREDGVTGDVDVQVTDGEDGRRVEVEVRKTETVED